MAKIQCVASEDVVAIGGEIEILYNQNLKADL
jgi:hypothetical protein